MTAPGSRTNWPVRRRIAFLRAPSRSSRLRGAPRLTACHLWRSGTAGQRGFTLIEMLIVLLIMGLFVGLVSTIAQPDDRARLRVEAERLAQLLDLAATQSRLTGRSIAWISDGPGYRFLQFNDDTYWTEIRDDDALRARSLPQGMKISAVQVENMRPAENMRLEFTPYGTTLSFSIGMSFGAAHEMVTGSPVGDISVLARKGTGNAETVQR
ncbi:MAG: prepilin-type N-terminal cleavage/methylation domain-containing protein [Burkholderiales bacterium]